MIDEQDRQARDLHQNLEFIGLRAQATTVGLIQLCEELVRCRILDDGAIERIKDSIYRELTVSQPRGRNRVEYEDTLRQRLNAIFPRTESAEDREPVGTLEDLKSALEAPTDDERSRDT